MPATGIRCTCTSKTDRKIDTRGRGVASRPSSAGGTASSISDDQAVRRSHDQVDVGRRNPLRLAEEQRGTDRHRRGQTRPTTTAGPRQRRADAAGCAATRVPTAMPSTIGRPPGASAERCCGRARSGGRPAPGRRCCRRSAIELAGLPGRSPVTGRLSCVSLPESVSNDPARAVARPRCRPRIGRPHRRRLCWMELQLALDFLSDPPPRRCSPPAGSTAAPSCRR